MLPSGTVERVYHLTLKGCIQNDFYLSTEKSVTSPVDPASGTDANPRIKVVYKKLKKETGYLLFKLVYVLFYI